MCPQAPERTSLSDEPGGQLHSAHTADHTHSLTFSPASSSGDPSCIQIKEEQSENGTVCECTGEVYSDCLGAKLSQDSQLSVSTQSLSQSQSQSSQADAAEATEETLEGTTPVQGITSLNGTTPFDGTKHKKRGNKKGKKKKPRIKEKAKDSFENPQVASAAAVATQATGTVQSADPAGNRGPTKYHRSGNNNSKNGKKKASKSEKRDRKSKKFYRRPEPEGGNSNISALGACDYDRIINSNEPLFSDLEPSGDEGDDTSPPPQPEQQSRLRVAAAAAAVGGGSGGSGFGVVGIFIPCSQLGFNSSTMIKYAIIGSELQNVFQMSNRVSTLESTATIATTKKLCQNVSMLTFL